MFKRRSHVFMDQEGEGAAGGAATGDAGAGGGAAAAGAGGGNGAAAGGAAGPGNALAAGASAVAAVASGDAAGAAATGAAVVAEEPGIPEKFLVKDAAGQVDHAATALKLARDGYLPLEKRLGSGDAPPKSITDYKVNVPESLADRIRIEDLAGNAGFQDFLAKAHGAGLNQKQLDVVVGDFLERGIAVRAAGEQLAAADCEAELRGQDGWKSETEYQQQVGTAFKAGTAIFGKDFDGIVKDYGNDARLIRGLASIGKEMAEDMPATPEAQAQIQENLDALMSSSSYMNANDPQHSATVAKVEALTKRVAGTRAVAGGRTHSFRA